ncbi:carbohydrate kinase [Spirochaetia bacterium]|nr:carbohydrate kinase [Spirochaetia bacterium]
MKYALAIDIGASGGRHILGHLEVGGLVMEEVHRFENGYKNENGALVWDIESLFKEICVGIKKCSQSGKIPGSIGIDTWGVDYVLIDTRGTEILPVHAYRDDARTAPFFDTPVPFKDLYKITGIAFNTFNTMYQLLADKHAGRLETAETFFLLPEYFSYRLTGNLQHKQWTEYTEASTTGLLDAKTKDWAYGIIEKLGLPKKIFAPVKTPPYSIGTLSPELQKDFGFDSAPDIIMIASHDTASAVSTIGDDANSDTLYISSGTWSLLGIVSDAVLTDEAREANYTNEGAHNGKIRFLKNIMGLWMIQNVRRELSDAAQKNITFAELETLAREYAANIGNTNYYIDVNGQEFISPPSMIHAIQDECNRKNQGIPATPAEIVHCVYTSLAQSYDSAIKDLEAITKKTYSTITIIGGGNKDTYLNELTERYTGKKVVKGLTEATAAGNLSLQLRAG